MLYIKMYFLWNIRVWVWKKNYRYTETEMSFFLMKIVTISSKWRYFRFSALDSHRGCGRVAASSEHMLWRSVWWHKLTNHLKSEAPVCSCDHDVASTNRHLVHQSGKVIISGRCASGLLTPPTNSSPGQNGRHFANDIFRCIFVNEKFCILIKISLKFVPSGPIGNDPALV